MMENDKKYRDDAQNVQDDVAFPFTCGRGQHIRTCGRFTAASDGAFPPSVKPCVSVDIYLLPARAAIKL